LLQRWLIQIEPIAFLRCRLIKVDVEHVFFLRCRLVEVDVEQIIFFFLFYCYKTNCERDRELNTKKTFYYKHQYV
jgi:hypothetical protein